MQAPPIFTISNVIKDSPTKNSDKTNKIYVQQNT